jgi:hypothetical protein
MKAMSGIQPVGRRACTLENPYKSPNSDSPPASNWLIQVKVVASLLIVQGVLEVAIGCLLFYKWQKSAFAVTWIIAVFTLAVLKLVAGCVNWNMRNRALGLMALGSAPLSVFAIPCLPTALILMIYGFVVYLNRDVKHAFIASNG